MVDAVIGKIVVNVEARIDKLEKQLNQGRRAVKDFEKGAGSAIAGGLAKFSAFFGVSSVVSVGAFTAAIAKSTQEIDNLAKTAQTIGIATESLAGLRHAANLTGVNTQTLDNSLRKMTIRISEAANGSGEAVKALEELGLSALSLKGMAPEKQFEAIASAMKGMTNHSDKVRIATKLFEEEGAKLVNTLSLGKSGLNSAAIEAKKLGLAISAEDAAKVEHLADAWDRFKKATVGASNQLTIAIAPAAAEALDGFAMSIADLIAMQQGRRPGEKPEKDWLQSAAEAGDTWRNPLKFFNDAIDGLFREQSRQRGFVDPSELAGLSADALARRQKMMLPQTNEEAAKVSAEAQAEENMDLMNKMRGGNVTNQRRENLMGLLNSNMFDKPVYEWRSFGKPVIDSLKGVSDMLETGGQALATGKNPMLFKFGQGLESFRQAEFNMQRRMEIAEEVKARGSQPRAQSNIIEQGTSEAFAALRKNLYKSDDKQRELVAINKAMLKAGVEQKDYTKELVDWFKNAVAVGT